MISASSSCDSLIVVPSRRLALRARPLRRGRYPGPRFARGPTPRGWRSWFLVVLPVALPCFERPGVGGRDRLLLGLAVGGDLGLDRGQRVVGAVAGHAGRRAGAEDLRFQLGLGGLLAA